MDGQGVKRLPASLILQAEDLVVVSSNTPSVLPAKQLLGAAETCSSSDQRMQRANCQPRELRGMEPFQNFHAHAWQQGYWAMHFLKARVQNQLLAHAGSMPQLRRVKHHLLWGHLHRARTT